MPLDLELSGLNGARHQRLRPDDFPRVEGTVISGVAVYIVIVW